MIQLFAIFLGDWLPAKERETEPVSASESATASYVTK